MGLSSQEILGTYHAQRQFWRKFLYLIDGILEEWVEAQIIGVEILFSSIVYFLVEAFEHLVDAEFVIVAILHHFLMLFSKVVVCRQFLPLSL